MSEIGFWAIPPKGTKEYSQVMERLAKVSENPEFKKGIKKTLKKAVAMIEVQQVNGLGFPADCMLREYNLEYNNRVLNGTLSDLPSSFNVAEAFNKFLPPSATFQLRREIDHLFSFNSFIDYVTSSEFDSSITPALDNIIEGVIYSFNSTSSPEDLTFSTNNGKEYGFSSVSIVRFDSEISILLLAGQECDLEAKTLEIKDFIKKQHIFSHRNHIRPSDDYEIKAMPLVEGSNLLKSIILARIDLKTQTFDARYVYEDWGQSYHGQTDDFSSYINQECKFIDKEAEKQYINMPKVMDEYQAIFELCKTCLFLPDYFNAKSEDVVIERHPTEYIEFCRKLKNRKTLSLIDVSYKISYREPYVIHSEKRNYPDRAGFLTPEIKIEDTGFWKKLPPQSQGQDKNGNTITGRTWVAKTLSWVESPSENSNLSIKRKSYDINNENSGYIYVMRSAAHQRDIFKIGLTTREAEVRAKELGRSTSSPDQFLVVEEWYVKDCSLAEKLIHEKLDEYRVNPKREYFKARYNIIFSAIDEIINLIEDS